MKLEWSSQGDKQPCDGYGNAEAVDDFAHEMCERLFNSQPQSASAILNEISDWRDAHRILVLLCKPDCSQELYMRVNNRLMDLLPLSTHK